MGHTLTLMGEFAQARRHYEKAIALYNPPNINSWQCDLVKTS
jgi:hypothetical protein